MIVDCHGNELNDGDSITVIKDLKLKGGGGIIKQGTKVKSIRLNPNSDHPINCKVPKIGQVSLKSEFVKKS